MRYKYILLISIICVLVIIIPTTYCVYAENDKNYKKEIAQFYYSVMNESGYITCALDITEKEDETYKLDIVFKENIHGINLGFYVTPLVIEFMEANSIDYTSGFAGSYIYTMGTATYDSMGMLAKKVSQLPFIKMAGSEEKKGFYAEYDLTIWDSVRKENNFIDDIYKTNNFLISYRPLKKMDTNADKFENGIYVWQLKDEKEGIIYAISKNNRIAWVALGIGGIIFVGGIYLILSGNSFTGQIFPLRRNKRQYDDYDGYDDYYDDYY